MIVKSFAYVDFKFFFFFFFQAEDGIRDGRVTGVQTCALPIWAVASWCAAHEEYGRLPLSHDLAAAIEYAREGYPVTGRLARWIEMCAGENALNAHALALFVPGGAAPRAGDKLTNHGLALVLERIAAS